MKCFLAWVAIVGVPVANKTMANMKDKTLRRKPALKTSQFLKSENLAPPKLGTEQIIQILRASVAVHTYALKNGRIRELSFQLFCNRNFSVTMLNDARFLQLVTDNSKAKAHLSNKMSVPTAFEEQLYFYVVALISRKVERMKLNIVQNARNSTMEDMKANLARKA